MSDERKSSNGVVKSSVKEDIFGTMRKTRRTTVKSTVFLYVVAIDLLLIRTGVLLFLVGFAFVFDRILLKTGMPAHKTGM